MDSTLGIGCEILLREVAAGRKAGFVLLDMIQFRHAKRRYSRR